MGNRNRSNVNVNVSQAHHKRNKALKGRRKQHSRSPTMSYVRHDKKLIQEPSRMEWNQEQSERVKQPHICFLEAMVLPYRMNHTQTDPKEFLSDALEAAWQSMPKFSYLSALGRPLLERPNHRGTIQHKGYLHPYSPQIQGFVSQERGGWGAPI